MSLWRGAALLALAALAAAFDEDKHMQKIDPADLGAIQELYVPLEHVCDGYDEQWDNCANLPDCGPCVPRDCVFAEWGSWQLQGGCTGLQLRQRTVEVTANQCGKPCVGSLTETDTYVLEKCKAKGADCMFSGWSTWSPCKDKKDQSMRTRTVAQPPGEGGNGCEGALQETRPCGGPEDTDCKVGEWHEWTTCSSSCGEGRYTRMRYVDVEAHHGGTPCSLDLLETAVCQIEPCPGRDCEVGEWSEWSMCDEMFTQRFRQRSVLREPTGDGKLCNHALKETLGCPQSDSRDCILSPWEPWTKCDKQCGGGQKYRERNVQKPPLGNGTCPPSQLSEVTFCNQQSCTPNGPEDCVFKDWEAWSVCSATCGEGSKKRSRKIASFASPGGKACADHLSEVAVCKTHQCQVIDCRWSDWEQWSSCSVSCDGGTKTRTRNIAISPHGGVGCSPKDKVEAAPCGTQTCGEGCRNGQWGEWREWSPCSGSCSESYRYRRRNIAVHPNYCGNATEGLREEYEQCTTLPPCKVQTDCELSEWGSWSSCSCHCFGMRHRSRYISTFPSGGGESCYNESLKEISPCNPGPLENTPMDCTNTQQQDCKMKEWQEWSQCSVSCGGGQQSRIREVYQNALGGGRPCANSLLETQACHTASCESHHCQDCRWGPWSQWGACPKCGGQRYRHRNIALMPNSCGRRCELHSAKEVSDCPVSPECEERLYCAWDKWTSPECQGKCGHASAIASRSLGLHTSIPENGEMLFEVNGAQKCAGLQLNNTECPFTHPCQACVPIPCVFSAWAEWQEPTCEGLCVRSRIVQDVNNECGTPCSGPLTETKPCVSDCMDPIDCQISAWTDWGGCTDPGQTNGQKYRSREIDRTPRNGGKPCLGVLSQTIGCHQSLPEPCKFSDWQEWNPCSVSCGEGWHSRTREIEDQAHRGGLPCSGSLRELERCVKESCDESGDTVPCKLGEWGEWSTCDTNKMRFRDKRIVTHAQYGGEPCEGEVNQGESCGFEPVNCKMSPWTMWGTCDRTCGIGQARRQRQITVFAKNGGEGCPGLLMETKGCTQEECPILNTEVSEWSSWGACSVTCGPGIQMKTRAITQERSLGGHGYEGLLGMARPCEDSGACPKSDCVWGEWNDWSDCSCTCGGGAQTRVRTIAAWPQGGGKECEPGNRREQQGCNLKQCDEVEAACLDGLWGDWSPWSSCSASCDGGTTSRTRRLIRQANECGCPPPGKDQQTAFCNIDKSCEPSKPCILSHWTEWTACSATCDGIKRRTRTVEQYGRGNGVWCLGGLREIDPCNPSPGEEPVEQCAGGTPVDCVESDWTAWSMCSKTCGGGEHMRSREIITHPKYGGRRCDGALAELKECARNACGGPKPVDCQFGEWEAWSSCDKCNGERKRRRKITAYPKYGGQECEPKHTAEVGKCPRRCAGQKYCEWAEWKTWSECTVTCGLGGKRRRRRYLELTPMAKQELPSYVTNVMRNYESLRHVAQELESNQVSEMLLSFVAGCMSLMLAVLGLRACSSARAGRSATLPSYTPLSVEMAATQDL
eukprot:TRINITY_DN28353_c0_g1_i1.p1 TRINITY_DN28353_c0_g1~~TRINITY_DN28353_c0_g1_i1.p1  ORF type:complete len:1538 (+),score=223.45 TRINITY_DN28353_c0_g1_i1:91-4704(+)